LFGKGMDFEGLGMRRSWKVDSVELLVVVVVFGEINGPLQKQKKGAGHSKYRDDPDKTGLDHPLTQARTCCG
jgi:hypothetical protein